MSYRKAGLILKRGGGRATQQQVKDLQQDLRRLGYLRSGIDGGFGPGTELAVKALQHDLLNNHGRSTRGDGDAPVRVLDYNRGRVDDAYKVNRTISSPLCQNRSLWYGCPTRGSTPPLGGLQADNYCDLGRGMHQSHSDRVLAGRCS